MNLSEELKGLTDNALLSSYYNDFRMLTDEGKSIFEKEISGRRIVLRDWFLKNEDGVQSGPFSRDEIIQKSNVKEIYETDFIKHRSYDKWYRATRVKGITTVSKEIDELTQQKNFELAQTMVKKVRNAKLIIAIDCAIWVAIGVLQLTIFNAPLLAVWNIIMTAMVAYELLGFCQNKIASYRKIVGGGVLTAGLNISIGFMYGFSIFIAIVVVSSLIMAYMVFITRQNYEKDDLDFLAL